MGTTSLSIERVCVPGELANVRLLYQTPELNLSLSSAKWGEQQEALNQKLLGMVANGVRPETTTFLAKETLPAALALKTMPADEIPAAQARLLQALVTHVLSLP